VIIDRAAHNWLGVGSQELPDPRSQPGYADKTRKDWWKASVTACGSTGAGNNPDQRIAVGQMHGGVLLDASQQPLVRQSSGRPAQRRRSRRNYGHTRSGSTGANRGTAPAAGFIAPTLRWMQKHDPVLLIGRGLFYCRKITWVSPDGRGGDGASDASATSLFDVRQRQWSNVLIERLICPATSGLTSTNRRILSGADQTCRHALGLSVGIPVTAAPPISLRRQSATA